MIGRLRIRTKRIWLKKKVNCGPVGSPGEVDYRREKEPSLGRQNKKERRTLVFFYPREKVGDIQQTGRY